ncbi:insulinase family protein, partial [Staphylococcus aureus]|uniref:insulinase family protein n=1 Tax=Staphylococcus aureus TaxID=1280 RepID=UPI001C527ECE
RQRTEDNPRSRAFERFKWISYPTSHYRQPVIGHMKTLNNIQLNDVKQWYKTWYTPNNAILVIVGDYQLYPKAYFPMALELEADRMSNLLLRQQDFEPEIKVVMEERASAPRTILVHVPLNVLNGSVIPPAIIANR